MFLKLFTKLITNYLKHIYDKERSFFNCKFTIIFVLYQIHFQIILLEI